MPLPHLICLAYLASGAGQRIDTPALRLEHQDATIATITNKLTGETLVGNAGERLDGVRRKTGHNQFVLEQPTAEQRMTTTIAADGEAVAVTQHARGPAGLRGVQWGLVLPADAVVLVPGHSGLRLDSAAPQREMSLDYPIAWECQFVIVQTERGGFLIRAVDDADHFKRLEYRRTDTACTLVFETQAAAPWEQATEAGPLTWRIEAFEGDWSVGARRYRDWAAQAFGLQAIADRQPAWAADVTLMVISGLAPELLDALQKRVDPARTMIYVPSWRVDSYDRNYPDYTPAEGFAEQVRAARARGFRVMLHVNYFGCTLENPAYAAMAPYHTRNPYNGELEYWNWTRATPPIKFAYIDPAAKAWRDLFCDRMAELIARTGADALHLDQTLCIYNDANGPIDGLNMMQGNLALHRELRERLPDVALGGEGLDEITCRYEAFAQRHLYGLSHADGTWSNRLIDTAHPVSSAVLRPFTAIVGYLGFSSPLNEGLFLAWERGYERFGVVPTLAHVGAGELASGSAGVELMLDRAVRDARLGLQPDFEAPYGDALFCYRDAAGGRWRRVAEPSGTALLDPDGRVVERRIAGVAEARVDGSIAGSVAWDAGRIFGLNTAASYLWSPTPRDDRAPHITSCEPMVPLSGRFAEDGLSIVCLGDSWGDASVVERATAARCGVRLAGGAIEWHAGPALQHESGATVRPDAQLIFMHPPWRGAAAAPAGGPVHGLGHTVLELTLDLPPEPGLMFEAEVGVNAGADAAQCDGILCLATATDGERQVSASVEAPAGPKSPLRLDLAPLAGSRIRLLLETSPGPAGSPSFDWGEWDRPRLRSQGGVPTRLTLALPREPETVIGSAATSWTALGQSTYAAVTAAPGRLYLLDGEADAARPGLDLVGAPWSPVLQIAGALQPATGYSRPGVAEAAVGGVTRRVLGAHPPNNGRLELHLPLRMAEQRLRLAGAAGVRDGNESEGVGFRVLLNDAPVWEHHWRAGEAAWQPFSVELPATAGDAVLVTLETDSDGPYNFDWAVWADLKLEAVQ